MHVQCLVQSCVHAEMCAHEMVSEAREGGSRSKIERERAGGR